MSFTHAWLVIIGSCGTLGVTMLLGEFLELILLIALHGECSDETIDCEYIVYERDLTGVFVHFCGASLCKKALSLSNAFCHSLDMPLGASTGPPKCCGSPLSKSLPRACAGLNPLTPHRVTLLLVTYLLENITKVG